MQQKEILIYYLNHDFVGKVVEKRFGIWTMKLESADSRKLEFISSLDGAKYTITAIKGIKKMDIKNIHEVYVEQDLVTDDTRETVCEILEQANAGEIVKLRAL